MTTTARTLAIAAILVSLPSLALAQTVVIGPSPYDGGYAQPYDSGQAYAQQPYYGGQSYAQQPYYGGQAYAQPYYGGQAYAQPYYGGQTYAQQPYYGGQAYARPGIIDITTTPPRTVGMFPGIATAGKTDKNLRQASCNACEATHIKSRAWGRSVA